MRLLNELEHERLQQEQWEEAMKQLEQAREQMKQEHQKNMEQMKTMALVAASKPSAQAVAWLQQELHQPGGGKGPTQLQGEKDKAEKEKAKLLEDLRRQQEALSKQIADITGETLMEQIRAVLANREGEKDKNKALLKALVTSQHKTVGAGGTNTLRPDLLDRLTGAGEFSMPEWLASLNRQEEGELDVSKFINDESDCRDTCRHTKMKSGMLDKSTTNIRHKEVWPQKNLGEDWAEEEIEFKQLRFEHLVAGETRTIETCSDPAQILGRLRLLRRIAYLKLRGIDWQSLRKMYAAILSSIETREYSWESNFDRFESILFRRMLTEKFPDRDREHREHREKPPEGRKRFCRDYNRPEGCPKSSPHVVWMGSGPSASKRMVHHCCAVCLIRDKAFKEHPENHPDCPHRT